MQDAEFEEKEFETPLVNQLLTGSRHVWAPGQVFEQYFGIDAAIYACNPFFWRLFGRHQIPAGVVLDRLMWAPFWHNHGPSRDRHFPKFAVNLLLQTKRPQYLNGVDSELSLRGIKGAYWRFKITPHQQEILERLSTKMGNSAVVSYACAAFHEIRDLYGHIENGTLVENSNFVRASHMRGHAKWTYDEPGCRGVACSEMESIDDPPFAKQLHQAGILAEQEIESEPDQAARNLHRLSMVADEVCKEKNDEKNPIPEEFFRRMRMAEQDMPHEIHYREQAADFLRFAVLMNLLATDWFVIGAGTDIGVPNQLSEGAL
jgi:hypothetical protein